MNTPTLRIARPSDDLSELLRFYRDGLGLTVLEQFEDHDGFDGIMLGKKMLLTTSSSRRSEGIQPAGRHRRTTCLYSITQTLPIGTLRSKGCAI